MLLKQAILCVFTLAVICTGSMVCAQEYEQPAVQINMDVLDSLAPSQAGRNSYYPPSYPVQKAARPMLTAPTQQGTASNYGYNYNAPPSPAPVSVPQQYQQQPNSHIVSFPIQVKERNDTYDPSLASTPVYDGSGAPHEDRQTIDMPIPDLKPVKSFSHKPKKTEQIVAESAVKVPPLPPRRPVTQSASSSQAKTTKKKPIELSKADVVMPAVPPQEVKEEALRPPPPQQKARTPVVLDDDKLASQLVTPDKMEMVKKVEQIASFAEGLTPMYDPDKAPKTKTVKKKVSAPPVKKADLVDISAPAPAVIAHADESKIMDITASFDEDDGKVSKRFAALEPASGVSESRTQAELIDITEKSQKGPTGLKKSVKATKSGQIPRKPPGNEFEKEYISLPFQPDLEALDNEVLQALDGEVLPLLRDNPQWRLQIQAFASQTKDQSRNARRTSLSRALAVRSHLLDQGIDAHRMDVRALGMQTDRNPADRVDFVFFDPAQN